MQYNRVVSTGSQIVLSSWGPGTRPMISISLRTSKHNNKQAPPPADSSMTMVADKAARKALGSMGSRVHGLTAHGPTCPRRHFGKRNALACAADQCAALSADKEWPGCCRSFDQHDGLLLFPQGQAGHYRIPPRQVHTAPQRNTSEGSS